MAGFSVVAQQQCNWSLVKPDINESVNRSTLQQSGGCDASSSATLHTPRLPVIFSFVAETVDMDSNTPVERILVDTSDTHQLYTQINNLLKGYCTEKRRENP